MTGVAQAADSIDDLVSFLGGETEESHEDEDQADESQPEDGVGEDQSDPEDESTEDSSEEEAPEDQASRKIKVPVKDENGQETVEEIDETELIAGYQRQKAFTQKTMELAEKERQATAIVQQRVVEASQHALQQAQMAKAAVIQLAGLRSEEDMSRLAVENPTEWVQENARAQLVNGVLQKLEAQAQAEQQRLAQIEQEKLQAQMTEAWKVLNEKGIDREKLGGIFGQVMKDYGVSPEQLGKLMEPGLAFALKDALAYRALQAKKPQIAQKVKEAERIPTAKKSLPPNERVNRQLGERFSKGRAKVNDLAAFLANNKL